MAFHHMNNYGYKLILDLTVLKSYQFGSNFTIHYSVQNNRHEMAAAVSVWNEKASLQYHQNDIIKYLYRKYWF